MRNPLRNAYLERKMYSPKNQSSKNEPPLRASEWRKNSALLASLLFQTLAWTSLHSLRRWAVVPQFLW